MKKLFTMIFLSMILCFNLAAYEDEYVTEEYAIPTGLAVGLSLNYGGCTGDCADAIDPGVGFGINLNYRLSLSFAIYVEYLQNIVNPKEDNDDLDLYFMQTNVGLNFYIMPTSKIQPFVTAGFGNYHLGVKMSGSNEDLNSDDSFDQQTVFLGGGIEYVLNDNMTIPVKLQYTKILTEDGEESSKDSIFNFLVGFNYYF